MTSIKNRLTKIATATQSLGHAFDAIPDKYKYPALAVGSIYGHKKLTEAKGDYTKGRDERQFAQLQQRMSEKQAQSLFNREPKELFADASSTAPSNKLAMLDSLFSSREKMQKQAETQLQEQFPYAAKHYKGHSSRSLTTAKEASSPLTKAFRGY